MRIVVLDGHTLNPGDLDWGPLYKLGDCQIYARTSKEQLMDRAENVEILLTNKVLLDRDVIYQLDKCRYIGIMATGYNVVDLEAATEKEIVVTNVPAYSTQSVAQMVFAHLLNLTHRVAHHAETVAFGKWSFNKDFCYWDYPLQELAGKTMGIIGFGRIGKAVARIADAFGMQVNVYTNNGASDSDTDIQVSFMDNVNDIFSKSDVVSLHCPLTAETKGMVNAERLKLMRPGAFLINTGRGPLVDEIALTVALNKGWLAGAGLDVLSEEPPHAENPLLSAQNCFITPHISWATLASRQRLMDTIIMNIESFINGKIRNQVN